jgi:hypothetical protein
MSGGAAISGITNSISIKIGPELKRGMRREVKSMKESTLDITQNVKNSSITLGTRHTRKLTHQMNIIGNITSCDCEINKTSNQLLGDHSIL